ncbi:MAG: hypothetical protein LJE93_04195, partial [Acidobacteria bacterium]|nr:hypothetical protein [Acidobacteriota bacterium]
GFPILRARRRTRRYVEHPEMRKHSWVRRIAGRSRQPVRYAGYHRGARAQRRAAFYKSRAIPRRALPERFHKNSR